MFLFHRRKARVILEKLQSAGLNYSHFFDLSEFSLRNSCYLKTDDTLLRAELTHNLSDDSYVYELFYKDVQICQSIIHSSTWYSQITHSEKNLDIFPTSLLKTKEVLATEKEHEDKQPDILLPIGLWLPNDLQMKHLSLLNISSEQFFYDPEQKQNFIKLSKKQGFSYTTKYDVSAHPRTRYDIQYNEVTFATIFEEHIENQTRWLLDEISIAFASGNPKYIINLSRGTYDENNGKFPPKIASFGTVESCIDGIRNNLYTTFGLELSRHDEIEKRFGYKLFDSEKVQLLINALQHNSILENLNLRGGIHLSKKDFIGLITAIKRIPTFKNLDLSWAKIEITMEDMPEIQKVIEGVSIVGNPITKDRTYGHDSYFIYIEDRDSDEIFKMAKQRVEQYALKNAFVFITNAPYKSFYCLYVENDKVDSYMRKIEIEEESSLTLRAMISQLGGRPKKEEWRTLTKDQVDFLISNTSHSRPFKSLNELVEAYVKSVPKVNIPEEKSKTSGVFQGIASLISGSWGKSGIINSDSSSTDTPSTEPPKKNENDQPKSNLRK